MDRHRMKKRRERRVDGGERGVVSGTPKLINNGLCFSFVCDFVAGDWVGGGGRMGLAVTWVGGHTEGLGEMGLAFYETRRGLRASQAAAGSGRMGLG